MGVTFKKKNLIGICIGLLLLIILGGIIANSIYNRQQEKNREVILQEEMNRSIHREYESLLDEYKENVKEYQESDNYYSREYYKKCLIDLVGENVLNLSDITYSDEPSAVVDEILMQKARQKALGLD
jgi:hypothetical protein